MTNPFQLYSNFRRKMPPIMEQGCQEDYYAQWNDPWNQQGGNQQNSGVGPKQNGQQQGNWLQPNRSVVYKIRSLRSRNDAMTKSFRYRFALWATWFYIQQRVLQHRSDLYQRNPQVPHPQNTHLPGYYDSYYPPNNVSG